MAYTHNPQEKLGKLGQEDHSEFEASLDKIPST